MSSGILLVGVAGCRQVGEDALLVRQIAANLQLTAATGRRQILYIQAVLVEDQGPVEIAQAVGNAFLGEVHVVEQDIAGQLRLLHMPAGGDVEGHLSGGDEVGVQRVCQRHADAALCGQVESAALRIGRP